MEQLYEDWLKRKLSQTPIELSRPWIMSKKWEKRTGRIMLAELTLSASPSDSFSYMEKITWPADELLFKSSVFDGILDGILIDLACTPKRVAFTLENIKWHEEHSVPRAYYSAARELVRDIYAADESAR